MYLEATWSPPQKKKEPGAVNRPLNSWLDGLAWAGLLLSGTAFAVGCSTIAFVIGFIRFIDVYRVHYRAYGVYYRAA